MRSPPLALLALLALSACPSSDTPFIAPDTDEDPIFAGTIVVDPTELQIQAPVGERTVGVVAVQNTGEFNLELESATLTEDSAAALVTDADTNAGRTISPDRFYEVLVVCTLPDETPATGTLQIVSNDTETPTVDVPVTCTPAGTDDG